MPHTESWAGGVSGSGIKEKCLPSALATSKGRAQGDISSQAPLVCGGCRRSRLLNPGAGAQPSGEVEAAGPEVRTEGPEVEGVAAGLRAVTSTCLFALGCCVCFPRRHVESSLIGPHGLPYFSRTLCLRALKDCWILQIEGLWLQVCVCVRCFFQWCPFSLCLCVTFW